MSVERSQTIGIIWIEIRVTCQAWVVIVEVARQARHGTKLTLNRQPTALQRDQTVPNGVTPDATAGIRNVPAAPAAICR